MAALYADENYPLGIVQRLRELGHDVLTAQEAGNANRRVSDKDVLLFATKKGRTVITTIEKTSWLFIELAPINTPVSSSVPTIRMKHDKR